MAAKKVVAEEAPPEGLFLAKDTPMMRARLTGFRDASRVCLREGGALLVAWSEARRAGEVSRLGPLTEAKKAVTRLRHAIEAASRWAWNEETLVVVCDHDEVYDPAVALTPTCRKCGVVLPAEDLLSVLEWLLEDLRARGGFSDLVTEAEKRLGRPAP